MNLGIIGLGRIGGGMTQRWLRYGHRVVGYDISTTTVKAMEEVGAEPAYSIAELIKKLEAPRAIWILLPAGEITESTITELAKHLAPGDTIIDGGNTMYKDDIRRAETLKQAGIHYIDQGTSGGIWGLEEGFCLMVGGEAEIVEQWKQAFTDLAPENGFVYCGPAGSGHFVKMVHNGIEYGMMQAYAEGFEIMQAKQEFNLDVHAIANVWRHGSVIRSWLLDITEIALRDDQTLSTIRGYVNDSGEGRWTIQEAIDLDVPAPIITLSLFERFHSRRPDSYAAKILAAMRAGFGGHAVVKSEPVQGA
jgi:6-phosphogluconate dehydrogenase